MAAPLSPDFFVGRVLPAVGHAIFDFITMAHAAQVRACSTDCRNAVAEHKWHDTETPICRDVPGWRACFPRATAANLTNIELLWDGIPRNTWVTDADFVHLVGLQELRMSRCVNVTDAAFAHLRGIHTLNMSFCYQPTITDAAFSHLQGTHTLRMEGCQQPTITDAAFGHLRGIHTLYIGDCRHFTDAAFAHLRGIHTLNLMGCFQLTNAVLAHLAGIRSLDISWTKLVRPANL
jgi:hypothetical protein